METVQVTKFRVEGQLFDTLEEAEAYENSVLLENIPKSIDKYSTACEVAQFMYRLQTVEQVIEVINALQKVSKPGVSAIENGIPLFYPDVTESRVRNLEPSVYTRRFIFKILPYSLCVATDQKEHDQDICVGSSSYYAPLRLLFTSSTEAAKELIRIKQEEVDELAKEFEIR